MRGKEDGNLLNIVDGRITPAYAGKSDIETTNTETDGDHPRVCGEKLEVVKMHGMKPGSPPRMRGKGSVNKNGKN